MDHRGGVRARPPPSLLVSSAPPSARFDGARRLGTPGGGRHRWVAEAVWPSSRSRPWCCSCGAGSRRSSAETGVDPLLAAVPLLLSLLACSSCCGSTRFRSSSRAGNSRLRELVPFLGSARALRDPRPASFRCSPSGRRLGRRVLVGAARHGADRRRARRRAGGCRRRDLRHCRSRSNSSASSRTCPASRRSGRSTRLGPATIAIDGRERTTTLIVVDAYEMRRVQAGRADATPFRRLGGAAEATPGRRAVGTRCRSPTRSRAADSRARRRGLPRRARRRSSPRTRLARTGCSWTAPCRPFADRSCRAPCSCGSRRVPTRRGHRALSEIAGGPTRRSSTPADLATDLRGSSDCAGPRGRPDRRDRARESAHRPGDRAHPRRRPPARDRLLPLLSTLGLTPTRRTALVAWEIGPVAAVAAPRGGRPRRRAALRRAAGRRPALVHRRGCATVVASTPLSRRWCGLVLVDGRRRAAASRIGGA